jgi:hypothetical protein
MISEDHPLRQLFHQVVTGCYHRHSGIDDPSVTGYIADLLTEFSSTDQVYALRDTAGRPLKAIQDMVAAADPVFGPAASFDEEREVRRHIGNYALFATGMYPESMDIWRHSGGSTFLEAVRTGKESYYIVSKFDLFEYKEQAPLFARLSAEFERCVYGLTRVREELDRMGGLTH